MAETENMKTEDKIIEIAAEKLRNAFHWESFAEIGHGTCSKVYRVSYSKSDVFSLKIEPAINPEILSMIENGERENYQSKVLKVANIIKNEIQTMKKLSEGKSGRYILKFENDWALEIEYEKYQIPCYIILMEYVQGVDQLIKDGKDFTTTEILQIGTNIGFALKHMHEKDNVHNDIKLSNVFYEKKQDIYKLGDYSIAAIYGKEKVLGGSMGYMAPEVRAYMENQENPFPDTKKADIYSFGIMLYRLLNHNEFPYGDVHVRKLYRERTNENLPPIEGVDDEILAVLNRACRKNPSERYDSVNSMLIDILNLYNDSQKKKNTDDQATITTYLPNGDFFNTTDGVVEEMPDFPNGATDLEDESKFLDSVLHGMERKYRKTNWFLGLGVAGVLLIGGIVIGITHLSDIYVKIGVAKYAKGETESALTWLQRAKKSGNENASAEIAQIYQDNGNAALNDGDYDTAIACFLQAKEEGYAALDTLCDTLNSRGLYYQNTDDFTDAEVDFIQSADYGSANAYYYLGLLYSDQDNPKADTEQSVTYLEKAAELGNADAESAVVEEYNTIADTDFSKKDYVEALEYYQKSADLENAYGQYQLGYCYYMGYGTDQDAQIALEWLQKSSDNGNADAEKLIPEVEYTLADTFYQNQDYENALYYYEMAADAEYAQAYYMLGLMYFYGYGVTTDYDTASENLQQAEELGVTGAGDSLNALSLQAGKTAFAEGDYPTAMSYFTLMQNVSDDEILYDMGYCYYHGYGVDQSYADAETCLLAAEKRGNTDAADMLGKVQYELGKEYYIDGNYDEAFTCFKNASARDNVDGVYGLYYCYANGKGVADSITRSAIYYAKFIRLGGVESSEYDFLK